MVNIIEINIEEFKKVIYDKYVELFSYDEQRSLNKIELTYNNGVEKIYKITLNDKSIGFIMLEKLLNHPYYLDYFAIFKEFQNKGYGTIAMQLLLKKIANNGIIGEIEKIDKEILNTQKRWEFYKKLGYIKVDSEYLVYNVVYTPIVYGVNKSKNEIDKLFFDYYLINSGKENVRKHCKILR